MGFSNIFWDALADIVNNQNAAFASIILSAALTMSGLYVMFTKKKKRGISYAVVGLSLGFLVTSSLVSQLLSALYAAKFLS